MTIIILSNAHEIITEKESILNMIQNVNNIIHIT